MNSVGAVLAEPLPSITPVPTGPFERAKFRSRSGGRDLPGLTPGLCYRPGSLGPDAGGASREHALPGQSICSLPSSPIGKFGLYATSHG